MSLKSAVQSLMGISYSHPEIAPKSAEYRDLLKTAGSCSVALRPVVEPVDKVMAAEELQIIAIKRAEYRSIAPVLPSSSPEVQAVNFRHPGVQIDPSARSEAIRRARVESAARADAPVEPRQPLIAPPPEPVLPQLERYRRHLRAEEALTPVMRKSVA